MGESMKFQEVFNSVTPPRFIRKEVLLDEDKRKVVAFVVSDLDWATNQGEGFDKKSGIILEKEKDNLEEKIVLYEWQGDNFYKVKDIRNQNWFKI